MITNTPFNTNTISARITIRLSKQLLVLHTNNPSIYLRLLSLLSPITITIAVRLFKQLLVLHANNPNNGAVLTKMSSASAKSRGLAQQQDTMV